MARIFIIIKVFAVVSLLFSPVMANSIEEFAARSQQKDWLSDGDCQKWGGKVNGLPKNPIVTLDKYGKRLGGYRNVFRYKGAIYVMYSVSNGGILGALFDERKVVICRFGPYD